MILIIGAGLSGLLTAYRLKKEGITFKILEARSRLGGRIHTLSGKNEAPVEMGATWFQEHHQNVKTLLKELNLSSFEQKMDDVVFFQQQKHAPVQLLQIPKQAPSYRISGGTSQLIATLYQSLNAKEVLLNQTVKQIIFKENSVQVIAHEIFEGSHVVLAIPPKLWAKNISFEPLLPKPLTTVAAQTHTWMEDSIKIALTYTTPFWQEEKIPGTFFSNSGPITEFYDHCDHKRSKFALCGFINSSYKNFSEEARKLEVLSQLKTVFGEKVEEFLDYKECIWSKEEFTFENSDSTLYPHQNNGNPIFRESLFENRLFISSSESAVESPGYMEGAIFSANATANEIIFTLKI